ncbi:DNA-dependent metalloprotease SPRTN isoform X2 [Trichomycterus rosablanca]|uniref:DNA-dependent metalloprotease SPRTN isoform X2 n=1 Tax=Trichomycterus rosablanca TaxID=2290929 RepID=UPI002F353BC5
MEDKDFLLALQLQEQFDNEVLAHTWSDDNSDSYPLSKKRRVESDWDVVEYSQPVQPERPLSIVDESWETLDPSPDIRATFLEFNDMLFWGKLSGVEVKWSPRMTLCAGVCSYEGRGGLCSIRLSEPLLKLRPRKDLVQTLLHEMIHALLFVTQNNRDRDGHGPEFCKHMNRINKATGTKITIYHSFHDEVDVYRQHWWRCNGPCQNRKPFFGYVKRAMNRAPSAQDPWWEDHRRTCGGTYTKIKEPENYGKKGKNGEKKEKNASKKPADKPKPSTSTAVSGSQDIRNILPFSGRGFLLGGSTQPSTSIQKPPIQSPPSKAPPSPMTVQEPAKTPPTDLFLPRNGTVLPKRSVSNHNAFVNINGSPVRITKTNGSLVRPKQRTVQDLFQVKKTNSPQKANSNTTTNQGSKTLSSGSASQVKPSQGTNSPKTGIFNKNSSGSSDRPKPPSAGSPFSKYFGSPKSSGSGVPGSSSTNPKTQIKTEKGISSFSSNNFGNPKSYGSGILGSSSGVQIKTENKIPSSKFSQFGSQERSGLPASSCTSIGSSSSSANLKQVRSPEKPGTGFYVPASSSRPVGSPFKSGTTSGARKRFREDHNSAHIFDFFQRVSQSPTASSSRVQREEETASDVPASGASGASSTSLSSAALTVHCPVCQTKVLESQINDHLDSCLR